MTPGAALEAQCLWQEPVEMLCEGPLGPTKLSNRPPLIFKSGASVEPQQLLQQQRQEYFIVVFTRVLDLRCLRLGALW